MSTKPQVYTMFGVGALTVWPDGTAVFKELVLWVKNSR
jgi:hypothetical protein